MEPYSLELTDETGRPIIKQPINIEDLLRRDDRSADVGQGFKVYLEEVPPGYVAAAPQRVPMPSQGAQRAAESYGMHEGAFGFGDVQQWYDVVQAVQRGPAAGAADTSLYGAAAVDGSRRAHTPDRGGAARPPSAANVHGASPSRSRAVPNAVVEAPPPVIPPPGLNRKDLWASYAPPMPLLAAYDYKKLRAVNVTPDIKLRKYVPLPLALHTCVMVQKGDHGAAHFLLYGGTNGKSDEAEVYEFSLLSSSWRRIELRHQCPTGSHSHSCVVIKSRMLIIGGLSYEGVTSVPEHIVREHAHSAKRLDWFCPKVSFKSSRAPLRSATLVHAASSAIAGAPAVSRHRSSPATSRQQHQSYSLDALVPRLAATAGIQLNSSARVESFRSRGFQPVIFDADLNSQRCRAVHTPVPLNVAGHTATAFGSTVYVFGGFSEVMEVSDKLIAVDPTTFAMRILRQQSGAAAPVARYYHTAAVYGQWILIAGGFDTKNEPLSDCWAFDCVQETWEQLDFLGKCPPRAAHAACVVGCRLLLIGGFDVSLDSEGAAPLKSVVEINLVPGAKGHLVKTLPDVSSFHPVAFASAASCGDLASVFLFGGITIKPPKHKAPAAGTASARRGSTRHAGGDNDSEDYSDDDDHEDHHAPSRSVLDQRSGADSNNIFGGKFVVSNKAFLLAYPEQPSKAHAKAKANEGPKLDHLGLPIDENELPKEFKAFLKHQDDFIKNREYEAKKLIKKLQLEESEAAEVNLYLKPAEIESLINKCTQCCDAIASYNMKSMPGNVPEREVRERYVEECVGLMRQAKDVLRSMKGHEGPKQVKSKGHRKKTGEKFEDHSAAKPFRRVIVMDLIHQTNQYMLKLRRMNKSLKTVEWPEKSGYLQFVKQIHDELVSLVDLIKEILERYITERVESLVKAEEKHKQNMVRLKQIVEKIQHDKIFKKESPDERREHRKHVLQRDERRERDKLAGGTSKKRRKRNSSRSPSPGSRGVGSEAKPSATEFKEVLIEIPKDEAKQLIKRAEWVQKAATEFAWHCANTMSVAQPLVAAQGVPGAPTPLPTAHQESVIRDADAARSGAIDLCNKIASMSFAFRSQLETDVTACVAAAAAAAAAAASSSGSGGATGGSKTAPTAAAVPTVSQILAAKETAAAAATAGAVVVDAKQPPIVPTLPPNAMPRPRDPTKNILLRLSSARPLLDNHAALKELVNTVGRIRHNRWDPNDTGGPKQDETAEKLCRALFHRETNLLARVNASFLMHKGARSPRKQVTHEDPLMVTSAAFRAKMKEKQAAAAAAAQKRPIPAITSVATAPSVRPLAVVEQPDPSQDHQWLHQPNITFAKPLGPLEQTFPSSEPPEGYLLPSSTWCAAWGGVTYHQEPGNADPPRAVEQDASREGPPRIFTAAPNDPQPVRLQPGPVEVLPLPPASQLLGQQQSSGTSQIVQPPPPVPSVYAAPASVVSGGTVSVPSAIPAAPAPAAAAPPPPVAEGGGSRDGVVISAKAVDGAKSATSDSQPMPSSAAPPPPRSPAPQQAPQWIVAAAPPPPPPPTQVLAPASVSNVIPTSQQPAASAGSTAATAAAPSAASGPLLQSFPLQSQRVPVPVAVASGPFNGGIGSLGTFAPIEDYMAVMKPSLASVGVTRSAGSAAPTASTRPAEGGLAAGAGNPGFKGKLTPGERLILQSRERNRHW